MLLQASPHPFCPLPLNLRSMKGRTKKEEEEEFTSMFTGEYRHPLQAPAPSQPSPVRAGAHPQQWPSRVAATPQAFWPPALIWVKLMPPAIGTGVGTQSNPYASWQSPEMSSCGMVGPAPSLENSFELQDTQGRSRPGSALKPV